MIDYKKYVIHEAVEYAQELTKKDNLTNDELKFIAHVYGFLKLAFQFKKYFNKIDEFDDEFKKKVIVKHDGLIYKNIDYTKYYSEYKTGSFDNDLILNFLEKNKLKEAKEIFKFTGLTTSNWNFCETKYLYFDFDAKDELKYELGIFFVFLPIINYYKHKFNIKYIYLCVTEKLNPFIEKYFPYIKNIKAKDREYVKSKIPYIGKHYSYIKFFEDECGEENIKSSIKNIQDTVIKHKKNTNKLGFLWYSNSMLYQEKSIPIGVVINTLGNNKKNLNLKCLQYNDCNEEIELFNENSKNKINDVFYNDFNTNICDIVDAVIDCKAIVGTSNFVLIASALGIPTLLTGSSPHHHWYARSKILPYLTTTNMNFCGDYEGLYKSIYDFVDENFD